MDFLTFRKGINDVNIYDIAKEAGVSASTVSRVINDKPGVNPKTREKIRKLLNKYNFTPSETARGLVQQFEFWKQSIEGFRSQTDQQPVIETKRGEL